MHGKAPTMTTPELITRCDSTADLSVLVLVDDFHADLAQLAEISKFTGKQRVEFLIACRTNEPLNESVTNTLISNSRVSATVIRCEPASALPAVANSVREFLAGETIVATNVKLADLKDMLSKAMSDIESGVELVRYITEDVELGTGEFRQLRAFTRRTLAQFELPGLLFSDQIVEQNDLPVRSTTYEPTSRQTFRALRHFSDNAWVSYLAAAGFMFFGAGYVETPWIQSSMLIGQIIFAAVAGISFFSKTAMTHYTESQFRSSARTLELMRERSVVEPKNRLRNNVRAGIRC